MRKRLETEKRELERKVGVGSAASGVHTRKAKGVQEQLARKKEELAEMRCAHARGKEGARGCGRGRPAA